MSIVTQIKEERKNAGMTQKELAKKIGVHQVQITRLETGNVLPTSKMLEKIAKGLGKQWLLI